MALGVLLSVIVILSNIALLALSGWFITAMALAGLGLMHLEFFTPAAAIRGLAVLRTLARYLERLVTHDATFGLLSELRVWLFRRLEPLAPARLQDFRDGDVLARFKADIESLGNFYLKVMVPVCAAAIASLVLLIALSIFSPVVAAIEMVALVLAGIVVPFVAQRIGAAQGAVVARERAQLQAGAADLTRGLGELQIAGAIKDRSDRLMAVSANLVRAQRKLVWIAAGGNALSGLIGQAAVIATFVTLFCVSSAAGAQAPYAAMLLFAVMAGGEIVAALPAAFAALGVTRAAASRIFAVANLEPAVRFPEPANAVEQIPTRFDIAFRNVTMRYRPDAPIIVEDLSFALPQGSCLALTGPSGAGKTTIIDLLQRFWEPQSGEILIGGRPLHTLSEETLRQTIAVVGQHTHLFNATIRDNLRLVRPQASDEDLWIALREAAIDDEVQALPKGLDTVVGELGAHLSGGQARRIVIARAFLSDAPIMLLDEPTEGLDRTNAARVVAAIRRLIANRTAIVIAHQAEAKTLADKVLAAPFGAALSREQAEPVPMRAP
jgi:ATP-binding cassette subfamily C protein CydC